MKEILLYRHAKTQKRADNLADFVRQLTSEGVQQASSIGKQLKEKELLPDHMLTSDAIRAAQTAEITQQYSSYGGEIEEMPELYEATVKTFLDVLTKQPDTYSRVAVIGHNPSIEEFLATMLGKETSIKTGWLARLEAEVDSWSDLKQGKELRLKEILKP